jgi:glycosyltransferase involved in cell wall biosynthesis
MLVSIIIPYFKDEKNIFLSVSSALKQTYKNIEIIIIDNENSINSKKILKKISKQSKKIEVIINWEKLGGKFFKRRINSFS